ncbi:MAG: serine hydrolase domain-containing protein [Chitinophagales bacterium]
MLWITQFQHNHFDKKNDVKIRNKPPSSQQRKYIYQSYTPLFYFTLVLILGSLSSCTTVRFLLYNKPTLDDLSIFEADTVYRPENPFRFTELPYQPLPPMEKWIEKPYVDKYGTLEEFLIGTNTTSFLVIRNDSILYENYFYNYQKEQAVIVFSISKAITTALVGIAIEEGYLRGPDQRVVEFLPAFARDDRREITLDHLMQMTSGLNFEDGPDLKLAATYYNNDQYEYIKKASLKHKPGTHFAYKSIDTQILGYCLEKAIGRNVASYLEEKLWQPLGMEYDAYITLDSKRGKVSRTYGGIAVTARDLAKLGRLFLHQGNWNGQQILPKKWVQRCSTIHSHGGGSWFYATAWWLDHGHWSTNLEDSPSFFASGYDGQYIFVHPEANMIMIRQGKGKKAYFESLGVQLGNLLLEESQVSTEPVHPNIASSKKQKIRLPFANNRQRSSEKKRNQVDEKTLQGRYQNDEGEIIRIFKRGKVWVHTGLGAKRFTPKTYSKESPQSCWNKRTRKRLIFDLDPKSQRVRGVYIDDYQNLNYYFKI